MTPCDRGPAPALLVKYGLEIGRQYAARRQQDPAHRFQWPEREGADLYEVTRHALRRMTRGHCAYCDGARLGAVGREEVDHFQPKSRPEFYELVCRWENLFLSCTACNGAKREQWEEALIRPDTADYTFEKYFEYRFDTGELHPNPAADSNTRFRADRTIRILGLNRHDACLARQKAVRDLQRAETDDERDDCSYRFLIPLARPV